MSDGITEYQRQPCAGHAKNAVTSRGSLIRIQGSRSIVAEPNVAAAGLAADRRSPIRARVQLSELTLIVRPYGRPGDVQAFTDDERANADDYAATTGGVVEQLRK